MPRQFEVFRLDTGALVIVLQHDFHDQLRSRVVAMLEPAGKNYMPFKSMMPRISLGDVDLRFAPHTVATLPLSALTDRIGTAEGQRDEILRALDVLLTGV